MSRGRKESRRKRRSNRNKTLALVLSMMLAIVCVAGGTIAWLNAKTDKVVNTFSTSDIGVKLEESKDLNLKMIPGWTIVKDPEAKVTSGSEDCYLFIKVEKSDNFDTYMEYAIDGQWTALDANPGVYYIVVDDEDEKNIAYNILGEGTATYEGVAYSWADDQVLVKPTVTEGMMDAVASSNQPTLSFTAYAIQLHKNNTADFTAAEAWSLAQSLSNN